MHFYIGKKYLRSGPKHSPSRQHSRRPPVPALQRVDVRWVLLLESRRVRAEWRALERARLGHSVAHDPQIALLGQARSGSLLRRVCGWRPAGGAARLDSCTMWSASSSTRCRRACEQKNVLLSLCGHIVVQSLATIFKKPQNLLYEPYGQRRRRRPPTSSSARFFPSKICGCWECWVLDAFKTILTNNNTASAFEKPYGGGGGIPIEYSLKFHIFQVKKELHEFKATNPILSQKKTWWRALQSSLYSMLNKHWIHGDGGNEGQATGSPHPGCNSLAQVGDFWAAEFLKEFESTLQNNPTLLYHPQHIISIQHVLETKATSTSWTQVIPNQHAITLALPASKLFGFY